MSVLVLIFIQRLKIDVHMLIIGFAEGANVEEFQRVCERTEGLDPEPMTRIAALLENTEQVNFCKQILATRHRAFS